MKDNDVCKVSIVESIASITCSFISWFWLQAFDCAKRARSIKSDAIVSSSLNEKSIKDRFSHEFFLFKGMWMSACVLMLSDLSAIVCFMVIIPMLWFLLPWFGDAATSPSFKLLQPQKLFLKKFLYHLASFLITYRDILTGHLFWCCLHFHFW